MFEVDPKMIEAFHVMWGNFPEAVNLVHKSREIVEVNAASQALGRKKGMNCAQLGTPEAHKGCLANQALATGRATYRRAVMDTKQYLSYWIPLGAYPDFYVHFAVFYSGGTVVDYDAPTN